MSQSSKASLPDHVIVIYLGCNLDNQMDIDCFRAPHPLKKCMGVLPACMNVHPIGAVPKEARRECWILWNWSHCVGAKN